MGFIKTILINILVLIVLLFICEVGARLVLGTKMCLSGTCTFEPLYTSRLRTIGWANSLRPDLLSLRYDSLLGYVPLENYANQTVWGGLNITVEGFRSNGSLSESAAKVLAVGDSFTFGEDVRDDQTWPACLERKLGVRVDNGGVSGYGAALSLRRAESLLKQKNYDQVVLSVLVGADFSRDKLIFLQGRPRPAVIRTEGQLQWSPVPDGNTPGSIFNPQKPSSALIYAYEHSQFFSFSVGVLKPSLIYTWAKLKKTHPEASDVGEIIRWMVKRFSDLKTSKRILLLQYTGWGLANANVLAERQEITAAAQSLPVLVVDTLDELKNYGQGELWAGHHTPFGNELVCEILYHRAFEPARPK